MPPRRQFVTVADAALVIGKSADTVWRYIRKTEDTGDIATDTYDGRLVVDVISLADYSAKQPGRGRPRTHTRTEH